MVIKKLNTMFHKHSRVLFGAFTVVIIVSFLGFLTPGQFGCEGMGGGENTKVGTAFGKKVTYADLLALRRQISVLSELSGRQSADLSFEQLFYAYCPLLRAQQMGIVVSDKEVAAMIRNEKLFAGKDGSFDLARYNEIVQRLKGYGITENDISEAFRLMLLQQKLVASLSAGITVTDAEAEDLYRLTNTGYSVETLLFAGADYRGKVAKPTAAALQEFFSKNRKDYKIDGKVTGLAAVFPAAGFRAEAKKRADAKTLEAFFKQNPSAFSGKDNKAPEFAKVRKQVEERFLTLACAELAAERAHRFATAAYDAAAAAKTPAEKEKAFRELAAREKALIVEAGADFSAAKFGSLESPALVRSLVELSSATPVANVVSDLKNSYVGFLKSRVMPRAAEYKEVAGKVLQDYQRTEAFRLAKEAAGRTYAALQKITPEKNRAAAFAASKEGKKKSFVFSMVQPAPAGYENALSAVFTMRNGDVSAPIPGQDSMLIVLLTKRIAPDMSKFAAQKTTCKFQVMMQKQQKKQMEFQQQLMEQCRWELPESAGRQQAL